jgi:hypothetical protein
MRPIGESGAVKPIRVEADPVRAAARNNAHLCDLVAGAHGARGAFADDAWTSRTRTPTFYPDAVTLDPEVEPRALLARIDASPAASVKDSFGVLDLAPFGFRVLFAADWIHRSPSGSTEAVPPEERVPWSEVVDADALTAWEDAWSGDEVAPGLFVPSLLDDPALLFLRADLDGEIVAGAVVNHEDGVAGLSNLFASGDAATAWTGCLRAVSTRLPGTDLVGYESGAALAAALDAGFRQIGPLRVWVNG